MLFTDSTLIIIDHWSRIWPSLVLGSNTGNNSYFIDPRTLFKGKFMELKEILLVIFHNGQKAFNDGLSIAECPGHYMRNSPGRKSWREGYRFAQGSKAFNDNLEKADCPYNAESPSGKAWLEGWEFALADHSDLTPN